jgi:hypothetical protein
LHVVPRTIIRLLMVGPTVEAAAFKRGFHKFSCRGQGLCVCAMQASVTIPGRNVKLFAKALGAIAKFSNEVVVEFGDGVSLRVSQPPL